MEFAERRQLLASVDILKTLPSVTLDRLAEASSWREVRAGGEVLGHLNDTSQVCLLLRGAVRAELTTATGRTVAIRKMEAPTHFGEIAALTGAPRTVRIIAENDGLIAECPSPLFLELMEAHAPFARAIAAGLARTLVFVTDRLFEMATLEVRFRVYAELVRLAREGAQSADGGVVIRHAPTHEMIAAAIGAQREAVTRELRHLVSAGVLKKGRRELVITNLARLKDMLRQRAGQTATQLDSW